MHLSKRKTRFRFTSLTGAFMVRGSVSQSVGTRSSGGDRDSSSR